MTSEDRFAKLEQRLAEVETLARSARATAGREGVMTGMASSPVEPTLAGNSLRVDISPVEVYSAGSTAGWVSLDLSAVVPKSAQRVFLSAYVCADQGESFVKSRQKEGKPESVIHQIAEDGTSGIQGLGKGEVLIGTRRSIEVNVQRTWAGGSPPAIKIYVEGYA